MGYGRWTSSDWNSYKTTNNITQHSTVRDIYKNNKMVKMLDPKGVTRESCDSDGKEPATPIIVGLDVTGSMGYLSEEIAKGALNTLVTEVYDKKPVTDPHILIAAIGDAFSDSYPLQVTQFEADIKIAEQMKEIYFEGCGGGNDGESYLALWYFAARHTKIDSMDKHNRKGFLFTIGDEPQHKKLTKVQIKEIFGDDVERDYTAEELLTEVSRSYEVFHLCVGNYKRYNSLKRWQDLLGERALEVIDHKKIPEIIESTLQVIGGKDVDDIANQWDGSTAVAVKTAIAGLSAQNTQKELIEFN